MALKLLAHRINVVVDMNRFRLRSLVFIVVLILLSGMSLLYGQSALAKVASNDTDWMARELAVGKSMDEYIVVRIAVEDQNQDVQKRASDRLAYIQKR